jgi:hypothetical protein
MAEPGGLWQRGDQGQEENRRLTGLLVNNSTSVAGAGQSSVYKTMYL